MELQLSLYTAVRFNFLYVDKYLFKQGWMFPENYVPYCMLRYILKGNAVFVIDGEKFMVHQNQVAYIPYGCMLECYSLEGEIEFISIRFAVTTQPEGNDFLREFFHLSPVIDVHDPEILTYFESVYRNATSEKLSRWFHIRGGLELIFARLVDQQDLSESEEDSTSTESAALPAHEVKAFSKEWIINREKRSLSIQRDPRIQSVLEYLVAHPEASPSSKELCEIAQMSPSSFRRHFKEHTGKSPVEFIKELRMMTAARQLLVTNKRVSDIAYELGFVGQNYFSRTFKAVFGVSPNQYRRTSRN